MSSQDFHIYKQKTFRLLKNPLHQRHACGSSFWWMIKVTTVTRSLSRNLHVILRWKQFFSSKFDFPNVCFHCGDVRKVPLDSEQILKWKFSVLRSVYMSCKTWDLKSYTQALCYDKKAKSKWALLCSFHSSSFHLSVYVASFPHTSWHTFLAF